MLTAFAITIVESFILCPFERLKTHFMTASIENKDQANFRSYFKERPNLVADLFRGVSSLFTRQLVAWVFFLQSDLFLRSSIRAKYNIPEDQNIPSSYLWMGGVITALGSTIVIMPFDNLKTHKQLFKSGNLSYMQIAQQIHKEAGFKGFFIGWRLRYSLYVLHSVLTIDLLERLEGLGKTINKNSKSSKTE